MCAKVISNSYTCWATYNNQKTTPGQEVHKFYPFHDMTMTMSDILLKRLQTSFMNRRR